MTQYTAQHSLSIEWQYRAAMAVRMRKVKWQQTMAIQLRSLYRSASRSSTIVILVSANKLYKYYIGYSCEEGTEKWTQKTHTHTSIFFCAVYFSVAGTDVNLHSTQQPLLHRLVCVCLFIYFNLIINLIPMRTLFCSKAYTWTWTQTYDRFSFHFYFIFFVVALLPLNNRNASVSRITNIQFWFICLDGDCSLLCICHAVPCHPLNITLHNHFRKQFSYLKSV